MRFRFKKLFKQNAKFSILRRKILRKPTKQEKLGIRILIIMSLFAMTLFLIWFFDPGNRGVSWLYWMLTFALLFKMLRWLHEWYHYFAVSYPEPPITINEINWSVDMLTTYCKGEPYDMVLNTLEAMIAVTYPHTTYLCDEANDEFLKTKCLEMGVIHITREHKIDAKAGNINNALKSAKGEICVILDPDHTPFPYFLDVVLPYFQNPKIGFVQVVQAYKNYNENAVAKGAAQQTYQFYGPLMMGMNSYGTTQAIGANCTFRRAALDSIGGHAPGLAEDMHTAMQLHAAGWKSVYVPEVLALGLVPSSISAYNKQQLKWARGTFELLFTVYPKLFRKLDFRQKLHYFTLPLHYLSGFVTLFDILIPVIALLFALPVWKINVPDFLVLFLPLWAMALLIRVYAQRWLAQKHERGMHLVGGVLRMGSWWIFILGFLCTIFRVGIPYIPTPKENEIGNDWKSSIVNIISLVICILAIIIGLQIDWSPYSIFMAAFSLINIICLSYVILIGQQKLLLNLKRKYKGMKSTSAFLRRMFHFAKKGSSVTSSYIRKYAIMLGVVLFVFVSGNEYRIKSYNADYDIAEIVPKVDHLNGGFYTGIYIPEINSVQTLTAAGNVEKMLETHFDIVSIYQSWGPNSIDSFPLDLLNTIRKSGSIPMITWEPYSHNFPQFKKDKNLSVDWRIFDGILSGKFDSYIEAYATQIRNFGEPVMIRFAHEMDNPAYPWSFYGGGNTPEEFINAHRYIVKFFNKIGASNVSWVWNPWEDDNLEKYYPGDDYVDWIGLTNLNYGLANSNGNWVNFEDLYIPFHEKIINYKKPVMLSEFGSTDFGGNRAEWFKNAFSKIETQYPEIKSIVFFYSDSDKNWGATKWRPKDGSAVINWTFNNDLSSLAFLKNAFDTKPFSEKLNLSTEEVFSEVTSTDYHSKFIKNAYPDFQLIVDNEPFYIKGVAYNVGQDWRDGNIPLVVSRLDQDFSLIKKMGANTIRKYSSDIYNFNTLKVAEKNKLKVMFGFWFENKIDYATDKNKLEEYEKEVLSTVKKFKDDPSILCWTLGNEVWGLLKQYYSQPYLTVVRNEYVRFVEGLAKKIHELDPNHPVFAVGENSKNLAGEFYSFRKLAPSIDVLGINSYYEDQISILPNIQYLTDTMRPYVVSEYGPHGYWDSYFSTFDENNRIVEDPGSIKSKLYTGRWDQFIEGKKGMNIGGIAYTWRDRMEGTFTWFGLTDYKGRLKPTYFALKEKWTGVIENYDSTDVYIYSPKEKIKEGATCTFYAITENSSTAKFTYEWMLCADDFMIYKINFKIEDNGKRVAFEIPIGKKGLRLYLFVADENNVTVKTASFSILK